MDEMKELEKLRLEFLKRGKDQGVGAIYRAELALEHREQPTVCVKIPQSGPDSVGSFVDGCIHFYQLPPLTLNVNLYATLEEIEEGIKKAVVDAVMERISFNKQLMDFDNPESTPPEFERGRGKKSPANRIEQYRIRLKAYDLSKERQECKDIAKIIYPKENSESEATRRKVDRKIEDAEDLIRDAQQGTGIFFNKKAIGPIEADEQEIEIPETGERGRDYKKLQLDTLKGNETKLKKEIAEVEQKLALKKTQLGCLKRVLAEQGSDISVTSEYRNT